MKFETYYLRPGFKDFLEMYSKDKTLFKNAGKRRLILFFKKYFTLGLGKYIIFTDVESVKTIIY